MSEFQRYLIFKTTFSNNKTYSIKIHLICRMISPVRTMLMKTLDFMQMFSMETMSTLSTRVPSQPEIASLPMSLLNIMIC